MSIEGNEAGAAPVLDVDYSRAFSKVPNAVIELLAKRPGVLAVYLVLLSRARHTTSTEPVRWTRRGLVALGIGQALCGQDDLAEDTGQSRDKVRTALAHLRTLGLITLESPSGIPSNGTIVTLCNYRETYPPRNEASPVESPASPQRVPDESPVKPQRVPTNKTSETSEKEKTVKTEETEETQEGESASHSPPAPAVSPGGFALEAQGGKGKGRGKGKRQRKEQSFMTEDWTPREKEIQRAQELGVDVAAAERGFRNYYLGKGEARADWNACFDNWISKEPQYGKKGGPFDTLLRMARGENHSPTAVALAELDRLRKIEEDQKRRPPGSAVGRVEPPHPDEYPPAGSWSLD